MQPKKEEHVGVMIMARPTHGKHSSDQQAVLKLQGGWGKSPPYLFIYFILTMEYLFYFQITDRININIIQIR